MKALLFVLEPLLLLDAVLWATIGDSYVIAAAWLALAIAMPKVGRWVENG